jgi:hypothetical protein
VHPLEAVTVRQSGGAEKIITWDNLEILWKTPFKTRKID